MGLRMIKDLVQNMDAKAQNKFINSWNQYLNKEGDFSDECVWNPCILNNPQNFWNEFLDPTSKHYPLALLGAIVTAYCPHACSAERNWSSHVRIHTKERNRLVHGNVTKISKIKHNEKKCVKQNSKAIARKYNKILDPQNSLAINILFGTQSAPSGIDASNAILVQEDGEEEEEQCSYDDGNDDKYPNHDNTEHFDMEAILNILNSIEDSIDDDDGDGPSLLDISKDWFDISASGMDELQRMIVRCLPS